MIFFGKINPVREFTRGIRLCVRRIWLAYRRNRWYNLMACHGVFSNGIKKTILLIVLYAVLISIITYPLIYLLISRDNSTVIGDFFSTPDLEGALWYFWWAGYSWENGLDFFHSDYTNYPYGYDLWAVGSFLTMFLFQPVIKICGLIMGYNFSVFIILLLNCLAMFLLFKELTGNKYLAFFGGALINLDYFTAREMVEGRLEILSVFWLIFYLYSLVRLKNTKQIRYIFLAALFFLLASLCSWYYLVIICFIIFVWLSVLLYVRQRRVFKLTLISLLLGMIFLLPFFLTFFSHFSGSILRRNFFKIPPSKILGSWDLANIFMKRRLGPAAKISMSLFIFSVVCAGVNRKIRRQHSGWFFLWIGSFIISLGLVLQFNRRLLLDFRFLFYWWAEKFPFMYSFDKSHQFLLLFSLASIVIITITVNDWVKKKDINKGLVLCGFMGLMILELAVYMQGIFPLVSSKLKVSDVYYSLAELPPGAVLKLPYNEVNKGCLYYQTIHQKKMFNDNGYGRSSLVSLKRKDFLSALGLFSNSAVSGSMMLINKKEDMDFFKRLGFKYVIFEKEAWDRGNYFLSEFKIVKEWLEDILGKPYMYDSVSKTALYILGE